MPRPKLAAVLIAIAIAAACEVAHAQEPRVSVEVESDAPEIVSREALASRIAAELGDTGPKVSILVRYRSEDRTLVVRATHEGGRVIERTVRAEGDADATRREAVLLASNVASDEARELLDALSARPPKPAPAPPPAPVAEGPRAETPAPVTAKREELRVVNGGLAYPIATNYGHPWVTTYFDLSLVFGMVGTVKGAQVGSGLVLAPVVRGVQVAPFTVGEDVEGAQIGVVNIARRVKGAQIGVVNIAEEADATAGVVSFHRDAIHPVAWVGNLGYFNAGIAFESKWLYTTLAMTYGSLETGLDPSVGGVGAIGTHVRIYEGLDVTLESAFSAIEPVPATSNGTNTWFHQRALLGYRFARRLRVFAGGGFRAAIAIEDGSRAIRPDFVGGFEF